MTAVQDAPAPALEIGRDRRRKEDQRLITGRTRWTDNLALPGDAAPRDGAQPVRARDHQEHRHGRGQRHDQRGRRVHRQGLRRRARASASTPGRSRPTRSRPTHSPMPATGSRSPARSSPWSWPAAPPRRATPPSWSTSSTRSCPAALDLKEAAADTVLAHPDLGTNKSALWVFDSAEAGHRRRRRGGHRQGPHRRHRDRAGVPPAAADPGVHGAALGRGRPDRRAVHDVVGHPDPAHRPVRAGRDDRRAGVEDPGDRPRRGRRLRRQAPGHARGVDHLGGRPPGRQAGQVHRDPLASRLRRGPPRSRPVAEAHPGGRQGRHGHRPQGRPARRPRRLRRASSAAASRCSARSCSTRSTSSRPTSSPSRPCSPTRPGPTPTAAPAGPRRRTPSSG